MFSIIEKYGRLTIRTRIIINFCFLTICLVLIISILSYRFIKELYLDQLSEQVNTTTNIVAHQIDKKYVRILDIGSLTKQSEEYYLNFFNQQSDYNNAKLFIFNKDLNIIIHTDQKNQKGRFYPNLILNRKEILNLEIAETTTSMPFQGDDNRWYLWGFYRLTDNYWLALQESADKFEKVEEFSTLFLYIGIIGTFSAIVLGWILGMAITVPIQWLVKFSSEIGKGNFNIAAPKIRTAEISMLSKTMDTMRVDLIRNQKQREEILAQIAHEIRNPLGGIELLANLTKEDINKGNLNAEYLNKIIDEVNGLKSLITSYLDYSKPFPAKPEWLSLSSLVKEIDKPIQKKSEKKNVKIEYDIQLDKIWFDPGQLRQILINLITNSVESIKDKGCVEMTAHSNKKYWKIEISDDGAGIPENNLPIIFDPFFTTKKEGTGLGLAITKKLCQENNAQIFAKNNNGKGCTFTIRKNIIYEI